MATYNIKWLRNLFGTRFFPVTHITAVRDNNNVNLETLLNNKADKATTLAGYGITNAYTKTETLNNFYALTGQTEIEATSSSTKDLNTYTTPGNYFCYHTGHAYVSNAPTTATKGFRLWVYPVYNDINSTGIRYVQDYIEAESQKVYRRIQMLRSSGVFYWSGWKLVQDNLDNYAPSHFWSLDIASSTIISATETAPVDLNNYTTPGTYVGDTLNTWEFVSNLPSDFGTVGRVSSGIAFRLYVLKNYQTGSSFKQRIEHTRSESCNVWERICYNNTWSNWVLVQDDLSKYALSAGSSSDARLKDKVDDINLNIEDIAKAPNLTFKWKDGKDDNLHGGTYAQYWENITPYYVHGSDSKTLEYGNLALTCSIELAKEMTKLKEENVQLKNELEDIKETLNKLNK